MSNKYNVYDIKQRRHEPDEEAPTLKTSDFFRQYGCNGNLHVIMLTEIILNEAGKGEEMEDHGFEELGSCDQSCGPKHAGFFIYPPEGG